MSNMAEPSATNHRALFFEGTQKQQQLMLWRWSIQEKYKRAKELGATAIPTEDIVFLNTLLITLSFFRWVDNDFHLLKMGKAVKLLTDETLFGDDLSNRANILLERWDNNNFTPGPIEDLFDEDDFSSDAREASSSADEGVLGSAAYRDVMRGIIVTISSIGRKTYMLDKQFPKRAADVSGDNGLTVGDWWPYQICALRDGAHGSRMGGIHGRVSTGAYSIVISGGYQATDRDFGDRILYSGSRGEIVPNSPEEAPLTNATMSLIKSYQTGNPVRVLRSSKCHSKWAPSVGIRYDGLYRVLDYRVEQDEGTRYYRFELKRILGQDPINKYRPNPKEVEDFRRVTGG
ncbi:PUA-like domain-containing protein [Tuber borchii]|uniref:PUA-like domain-containing protein n=1 Tax=Tuber borchii TaxID=42251 RepID=A0A2T6ZKU1_TUBBO|nr:PUA-like domain-containing protein [Tuber borchii]